MFDAAEESYCTGIQRFDFSRLRAKLAYVFDLSGPVGGAAYQAPSILSFRAVFTGRAAHAAFSPEEGGTPSVPLRRPRRRSPAAAWAS
ncbi:MAG: hypothetical protein ACLUFI_04835 [Oscillospiraceae bacterium]